MKCSSSNKQLHIPLSILTFSTFCFSDTWDLCIYFINKRGRKNQTTTMEEKLSHQKTHPNTHYTEHTRTNWKEETAPENKKRWHVTRGLKLHGHIKRPDQKLLEIPMFHHSLYRPYHIQYFTPFRTNSCILHVLLVHLVIQEKVRTFSSLPTFGN